MKSRAWFWVIIFLFGILVLSPAGSKAAEDIKIGLVTPLSAPGDYEAGKIKRAETVELAVEQLNQKGGILGRKVVLVKADDEGKPAVGATAVQRVIANDKVSAIVGAWHGSVAVAQAKIAYKMGVPIFFHYSWPDDLTAMTFSQLCIPDQSLPLQIAGLLVPFLVQKGFKNVAVMHETTAYGTGFAEALAKAGKAKS